MIALLLPAACSDPEGPAKPLPAALELVSDPPANASVGTSAGNLTVRVRDAGGNALAGVVVHFTVSLGGGRANPAADTTLSDGTASTTLTLGTQPGQNQVTATVRGVDPLRSATVLGTAGPGFRITITGPPLRFPVDRSTDIIRATSRDSFGNSTGSPVAWVSRDPGLVSVTPGSGNSATVQVLSRPGQTYLVATSGAAADSVRVSALDPSSSPCEFAATPTSLAVGAMLSFEAAGETCIHSDDADAEYALISHYGSPTVSGFVTTEVTGVGVVSPAIIAQTSVRGAATGAWVDAHTAFESALRRRERRDMTPRVSGARLWFGGRASSHTPMSLAAAAKEGDVTSVNVNAFDFCSRPAMRAARIAAVTGSAVILADTLNPPGGFTDAEYREFAMAMDTLVSPVDTTAFGSPTDIDGNGRVAILFTSAVNALTARGSGGGVVLGFFYSRDLLPRLSTAGSCPGSNVAEMFYILVPDTGGVVSDRRSKAFVQDIVVGTIAHEYQHLINASRRLYMNKAASVDEELWLNEGLSHIAEELVFYRSGKLTSRQNLGAAELQGGAVRAAFDKFLRGNFNRYLQYLRSPELNSPIATDDALATRGAAWSLLRYIADRAGTTDGTLWYRMVNSPLTGMANVDAALASTGLTALGLLRDWSVSVLTDDNVSGSNSDLQQPSWNFITGMPAVGLPFDLTPGVLTNGLPSSIVLRAAGSSYLRFGVPQNQEALLQVTGPSRGPVPPGLRLIVVRTR